MTSYKFWENALKGNFKGADANTPAPGFYKAKKHKDGNWFPVAIWYNGDECLCADVKGTMDPFKVWPWCAKHPISEADFRYYEEHGRWQGEAEIGHNSPPDAELAIDDQIKDIMGQAEAWLEKNKITSQEQADKAAGFSQKLSQLSKDAEKKRKAEKQPHLDAGKAIDAKYKAIVDLPKNTIAALKAAITPFLIAEQEKKEEAARKERAEAAKKIVEAEKIKADKEKKNLTEKEEKIIKEAETAPLIQPKPKASVGGHTGRKVSLRTKIRAEITDYEKALIALKDHPEMKDFVQKLCDRAAKADKEIDGMKIIKEKVAA